MNKPTSNQEVFDTVIAHLRQQKVQAKLRMGCAYRGANGTKCAFGVLIPDELYRPSMEGKTAETVCEQYHEVGGLFPQEVRPLLAGLQALHDDHDTFDNHWFEDHARAIARERGLTYTAPQGATA